MLHTVCHHYMIGVWLIINMQSLQSILAPIKLVMISYTVYHKLLDWIIQSGIQTLDDIVTTKKYQVGIWKALGDTATIWTDWLHNVTYNASKYFGTKFVRYFRLKNRKSLYCESKKKYFKWYLIHIYLLKFESRKWILKLLRRRLCRW